MKKLDSYLFSSLIETFIFGIVIFASVMLASEAFLDVVRQMSRFGIPINIALLIVGLRLPGIIVYTIPMAVLVSVILTYNRLSNNLEVTAIRACGVSIYRLLAPALVMGIMTAFFTLFLNEVVVPKANYQARNIMLWSITQRNLPRQSHNFVFKELGGQNQLRRLFFVDKYIKNRLNGVIVIDFTHEKTTKIIQSNEVLSKADTWEFLKGTVYTVSSDGKLTNTSSFGRIILEDPINLDLTRKDPRSKELNYFQLSDLISEAKIKNQKLPLSLIIKWHEKLAIPFTCILVALIGMPLALSPPRARFNRGLGFSVGAIFVYYLLRAISMSLGEINFLTPLLAAWLPNIIILILGLYLLQRKNYC